MLFVNRRIAADLSHVVLQVDGLLLHDPAERLNPRSTCIPVRAKALQGRSFISS